MGAPDLPEPPGTRTLFVAKADMRMCGLHGLMMKKRVGRARLGIGGLDDALGRTLNICTRGLRDIR